MEKGSLLERRRKAFIDSVFHYLKSKSKSPSCIRIIEDAEYQIDLDKQVLNSALLNLYENKVCKGLMNMSDEQIISAYAALYTRDGNITKEGKEFFGYITELIAERLHQKALANEKD